MASPDTYKQLAYELYNRLPGGEGHALDDLDAFSDKKFEGLLDNSCAHLALDYLQPFLENLLPQFDVDPPNEFWRLYDGLVLRAVYDAKFEQHDPKAAMRVYHKSTWAQRQRLLERHSAAAVARAAALRLHALYDRELRLLAQK